MTTINRDQGRRLCLAIALEDLNTNGLKIKTNLFIQRGPPETKALRRPPKRCFTRP